MTRPKIIIIAGPNGAGKTTFAREFLPHEASCPVLVNADLIAAGLSPFAPERGAIQAGRLTLAAIAQHVAQRVRQVGHDIPEATIRRRFDAGKRLFAEVYQPLVDQWVLYDNAGDEPQLISWNDKP
jgi:predicted ABC-type ATPase